MVITSGSELNVPLFGGVMKNVVMHMNAPTPNWSLFQSSDLFIGNTEKGLFQLKPLINDSVAVRDRDIRKGSK